MVDSQSLNAVQCQDFVSFQLTQCLSRLLRASNGYTVYSESPETEFFMDNEYSDDPCGLPSIFGEVAIEDCMERWISGLQDGEPRSLALLCKALERADLTFDVVKDNMEMRHNQETYALEDKIRTLKAIIAAKEEKLKEKAKKTEPKKKTSKAKKGAK